MNKITSTQQNHLRLETHSELGAQASFVPRGRSGCLLPRRLISAATKTTAQWETKPNTERHVAWNTELKKQHTVEQHMF